MISEAEKNNFKTIFAHPDFQPVIGKKYRPKEPFVIKKPEIFTHKRVRPSLNYSAINDQGFNEEDQLIQPDNPTNDIQTKAIETGIYNIMNRLSGSCL